MSAVAWAALVTMVTFGERLSWVGRRRGVVTFTKAGGREVERWERQSTRDNTLDMPGSIHRY